MKRAITWVFWWTVSQICDALPWLMILPPATGGAPTVKLVEARCGCAFCSGEVVYERGPMSPRSNLLLVISFRNNPGARA